MKNSSLSNAGTALTIIVLAQFACTSLWFASNAILPDLQLAFGLPTRALGDLTSAVQFGFIIGTLVFALFTISDRYSPSLVFFISAIAGSIFNLLMLVATGETSLIVLRALTGFFLAGIYPVGMKIASDYHEKGLGKALGFLVGALVLGTSFPHLLKSLSGTLPWKYVIYSTSTLALFGGAAIFTFVPNGPYRKKSTSVDLSQCIKVFKEEKFRSAAFGYFGHMWELYTFWAFVPVILTIYGSQLESSPNISLWSFTIIAIGGPACVLGGYWSQKIGSKKAATFALSVSGLCCLGSFFAFQMPPFLFLLFLLFWGMAVILDSPQFSTLVAQSAPRASVGTALTIVNSIGFAITIVSLQVMNVLLNHFDHRIAFMVLAIGPALGLLALRNKSSIA